MTTAGEAASLFGAADSSSDPFSLGESDAQHELFTDELQTNQNTASTTDLFGASTTEDASYFPSQPAYQPESSDGYYAPDDYSNPNETAQYHGYNAPTASTGDSQYNTYPGTHAASGWNDAQSQAQGYEPPYSPAGTPATPLLRIVCLNIAIQCTGYLNRTTGQLTPHTIIRAAPLTPPKPTLQRHQLMRHPTRLMHLMTRPSMIYHQFQSLLYYRFMIHTSLLKLLYIINHRQFPRPAILHTLVLFRLPLARCLKYHRLRLLARLALQLSTAQRRRMRMTLRFLHPNLLRDAVLLGNLRTHPPFNQCTHCRVLLPPMVRPSLLLYRHLQGVVQLLFRHRYRSTLPCDSMLLRLQASRRVPQPYFHTVLPLCLLPVYHAKVSRRLCTRSLRLAPVLE